LQRINTTKLFIDGLITDRKLGAFMESNFNANYFSLPLPNPIQKLKCIAFAGLSGDSILEDEFIQAGPF
jgi:hypothetical protein